MEVSKIDICAKTDKLRELILQRPELPIVVLTDYEVVVDDSYSCWYGQDVTFSIEKLIQIQRRYDDYWTTVNDESDLKDYLENELADMDDYKDLSDSEFDELVKAKLKEYEPLWSECIVIRSSI